MSFFFFYIFSECEKRNKQEKCRDTAARLVRSARHMLENTLPTAAVRPSARLGSARPVPAFDTCTLCIVLTPINLHA